MIAVKKNLFWIVLISAVLFFLSTVVSKEDNEVSEKKPDSSVSYEIKKRQERFKYRDKKVFREIEENRSIETHMPFENYSLDDALEELKAISNVTPFDAVRMKYDVRDIDVGAYLNLPEIEGNIYTMQVEQRVVSARGNITIIGSFEENGIVYDAVITRGKDTVFISMRTPEGNYEADIFHTKGLLYSSRSLQIAMHDKGSIDTLKPD